MDFEPQTYFSLLFIRGEGGGERSVPPRAAEHGRVTNRRKSLGRGWDEEWWGWSGSTRGTRWHTSPRWHSEGFEEHKQAPALNTKTFQSNTATETQLQSLSFEAPATYTGLSTACARVGLIRSRGDTRGAGRWEKRRYGGAARRGGALDLRGHCFNKSILPPSSFSPWSPLRMPTLHRVKRRRLAPASEEGPGLF